MEMEGGLVFVSSLEQILGPGIIFYFDRFGPGINEGVKSA